MVVYYKKFQANKIRYLNIFEIYLAMKRNIFLQIHETNTLHDWFIDWF